MRRLLLGLALLFLATIGLAQAHPAPEPRQITLLTFAPGQEYWQRFGHNALLVQDPTTGFEAVYNYGMFNFAQENFFLNFARGKMQYQLAADSLHRTLALYASEGRWVYAQQLNLDAAQRRALADFLAWNAQPENAEYRYDYFLSNCSTRIRDALDQTLDGALRRQLQARIEPASYRYDATRLITPIPALMAGMDFIMGPEGDHPQTLWQRSFVPEVLMRAVRETRIGDAPLVKAEGYLLANTNSPVIPDRPLSLLPITLTSGLLLGLALPLLAMRRSRTWARWSHASLSLLWLLICSIAGLISLLAWVGTEHWVMWANRNLLLASPLALLLLPEAVASFGARWRPATVALRLSVLMVVMALLVVALQLLPDAQQQWPWLALALPAHLGLAYSWRRAAS